MNALGDSASPPLIAEGLFSYRIGGSERVGVDLAIEFKRRGYRVACFAFYGSQGPFKAELQRNGIECPDLDYTTRLRFWRRLSYQYEFYRFLKSRNVAALHVHHATALLLCAIPARLAGVKNLVMTEHALFQLQEGLRYRASSAWYCRFAAAITGVHQGIVDYFHDAMHIPRDRLHVVSNGVRPRTADPATRQAMRLQLGIPADDFVFLYEGRLEDVKDLGTLLGAYAALPEAVKQKARLVLAGDGACRSALQATQHALGLGERVTFLGARTDIPDLHCMADAFVMTSRTEGLPMALIEAMGTGLPCVSTAVGGIPQLLADGAGLLAPPKDVGAIAAALARLVAEPELRGEIARRGKAKVASLYGMESIVTQYLALMGLPAYWPPPA